MSKKTKLTVEQQSKLLVQNILNKDTLKANQIFEKLLCQLEQVREASVRKLIMEQDQLDDELDDIEDTEDTEDTGADEGLDDLDADDAEASDEIEDETSEQDVVADGEVEEKVDDSLQIQCQINAKRISYLFDVIAELKKNLESQDLNQNSKEYIKSDVTISYYSDKLQEFQGKTNPGVDQAKMEEALDKIEESLNQLKEELGGESDEIDTDIDTPEEVTESEEESTEEEGLESPEESTEEESTEEESTEEEQLE